MKSFYPIRLCLAMAALACPIMAQTLREVPRIGHEVPDAVIQEALLRQLAVSGNSESTANALTQVRRPVISNSARGVLTAIEKHDDRARILILEYRAIKEADEALRQRARYVAELQRLQRGRDEEVIAGFTKLKTRLTSLERADLDRTIARIRSKAFRQPAPTEPARNRPEVRQ